MIALPLDEMSVEDKLRAMELLWEDLSRRPADLPVPAWHDEELRKRESALARGDELLEDWEAAKERIRKAVREG